MRIKTPFMYGFSIGVMVMSGIMLINIQGLKKEREMQESVMPKPDPNVDLIRYRGHDYRDQVEGEYIMYTDQVIRDIREEQSYRSDGGYIHTPGRVVPSREEEIEQYIEDNIEEYIDKYRD